MSVKLTKKQVVALFWEAYPELKGNNKIDYWTKEQAWSFFVDSLCKSGQIETWQYENWLPPFKAPEY